MKLYKLLLLLILIFPVFLSANDSSKTVVVSVLEGEKWWGGIVALGNKMPFHPNTALYDLSKDNMNNQISPLLLSSKGRYVWSEEPFRFKMLDNELHVLSDNDKIRVQIAGTTLRDAYLAASRQYFPPTGKLPEELFFSKPQYNTWIELMYDQNQRNVMEYANSVLEQRFPPGVFMIDDNWQKYYGNFEFKPEKFPDPKAMCDSLHTMGFKVMLWLSPFISADSPEYRLMRDKGYLLKDISGVKPAIVTWWNGMSACLDVTNPAAVDYFTDKMRQMQRDYGVDGFKLDAGDVSYMSGDYSFYDKNADANLFCLRWAEIGLRFPYNELRTSWKLGGKELVQRLGDKNYSWSAISLLIPDMIAAGLLGHLYTCPDMIGGGQFSSFLDVDPALFDQELIVRSCQVHALMPMMQFSVAPWRILDQQHLALCRTFAWIHQQMGDYILETARYAARSGEPMVRHMEYSFPDQGFVDCKDQFMLGDRLLVAPMLTKGTSRIVRLPLGRWKDDMENQFEGPVTITIEVPIARLPFYKKID